MIEVLHDLNRLLPSVFPEVIEFRGALYEEFIRRLIFDDWDGMHDEYLAVGGAGTGKTSALAFFFHGVQKRFPGAKGLVLRENRVDLNNSFMETFEEEVLDIRDMTDAYVLFNGTRKKPVRENRKHYLYPPDKRTGRQSRTVLGGMDKWERFRSTRWDWILIIEATEVAKENVEGIQRSMRPQRKRPGERDTASILRKRFMVMETNPDGPEHHLRKRADRGVCKELLTTVRDNAGFWDRTANDFTDDGRDYIGKMTRGMSGHVYKRLVLNEWAGAVGGVFEMWSRQTHVVHARVEPGGTDAPDRIVFATPHPELGDGVDIHWYVAGYDQGIRNAAALSVWAIDAQERSYLVHEVYAPGMGIEWWAARVVEAFTLYPVRAIACDHNWYFINKFNEELHKANVARFGAYNPDTYLVPEKLSDEHAETLFQAHKVNPSMDVGGRVRVATNATKSRGAGTTLTNLELLRRQMMPGLDGAPRLMVLSTALQGTRPEALDVDKPWGFVEEVERAVWSKQRQSADQSLPKDEIDKSCDDHAIDGAAYAHAFAYGRNVQRPKGPSLRRAKPGTFEYEEERRPGRSLFAPPEPEPDEREDEWYN